MEPQQLPTACLPDASAKPAKRRRLDKKRTRPQLLTRAELDGRTNAAKAIDRLVGNIEADLGGHDELSAIEVELVEAFAGSAVAMRNLNTRLALGEQIDLGEHSQAISTMLRVASRLGLQRRAKDISGPTLGDLLRDDLAAPGAQHRDARG
jgi:hypothetical protein